ncbi:MAG: AbrB/MazE/SpoVT family DNA-binding domain-containing protein [Chloroflexi bacterium]|nr:AbrB/MazE/SpoVT family DNA-binding domain-containing protein [Chloroflexota bacterium]
MTLTRVRPKGQITIPEEVRRALRLEEGDLVEVVIEDGSIVLRPKRLIEASQAWFWTDAWQAGEREASADIDAGRVTRYESGDELLRSLE